MASLQNVLLLGASGRAGSAIKDALLSNRNSFARLGVVTSADSYANADKKSVWKSLEKEGVYIIPLDLTDKAAMVQAFRGMQNSISV
jgi:uncharacterized protein YbjT (DUF2867 family)